MSQLDLLYRLQQLDTEIGQKKARLGEVLRAQKGDETLTVARQRESETAAELAQWQTTQSRLNGEMESLSAKARRSEQRLYSGNVKNPKELSDLQLEIESLGRRRADYEDEILEAMIMVEDSQAAHEKAAARLQEAEAAWAQKLSALQAEQHELATRLNQLVAKRAELTPMITADSMRLYERTGKSGRGLAVVALKNNICTGCQVTVSAQTGREAREGKLVYCGGCGRILYPA